MADRVYLHVGGPKSGTTYLQRVLRGQRERFAEHGVLVAGEAQVELVHAAMVLRGDRRLGKLPPRARGAWDRVVAEVLAWEGPTAVLSYELLSNLTAEQAQRAVADLGGCEVHVVVTARDLGRAVASAWQERLKFGLEEPLEQWAPPADTVVDSEWGWRTLDPASVASRWSTGRPSAHTHVVTVPRDAGPEELWRRFAEACDLLGVPVDAVGGVRVNESLDVVAAELLRRANPHLKEFLRTGRDLAVWERDLLANRVLGGMGREPLRPTPAQHDEARARFDACVLAVTDAAYTVHGDLADLEPLPAVGRTPGEVTDGELLDLAIRALAALLREVREDAGAARPALEPGGTPAGRRGGTRTLARRIGLLAAGLASRPVLDRNAALHARLDQLEDRLDDRRRLQQRMAMLTDLVAELLLPAESLDNDDVTRLIENYRRMSV